MVFRSRLLETLREPGGDRGAGRAPPAAAGLLLEKLATERSGEKGDRDLLVALGLLIVAGEDDLAEAVDQYRSLPAELRHTVRTNLATLTLLEPRAAMPDPRVHRHLAASFLERLEREEGTRS